MTPAAMQEANDEAVRAQIAMGKTWYIAPGAEAPVRPKAEYGPDKPAKIILLGSIDTDKIGLVEQFIHGTHGPKRDQVFSKGSESKLQDGKMLTIWGTAGQEKYGSMAPMYYRDAAAAIIFYDAQRESWLKELSKNGDKNVVKICVNICEQEGDQPLTEVSQWAEANGFKALLVNYKTGAGVQALFEYISATI